MLVSKAVSNNPLYKHPSATTSKTPGSLTRSTVMQIAVSVTAVIVAATAISYSQIISSLKAETLGQLKNYIVERGQREESIFTLAEDNHAILKEELLRRLQDPSNSNPATRFDQLLLRSPDGVIRNRPGTFDGKRQSGIFIDKSAAITPDIRRRVITSYDLLNAYGAAWHNRFQDTYIMMPENIMVIYWPEVPNWAQDASASLYMPKEEYYFITDQQHNSARKTAWTGLYYEAVSKLWMVSAETPVDVKGKQIATLGQDVMLNDLMQRTVTEHIQGGYNLIFRADGRLIAHPNLMEKIQAQQGTFNILESNDAHLKNIFNAVKQAAANQIIVDNSQNAEYLAVTKLEGPDWYFVTVLPKSVLTQQAIAIARFTLFLGLCSLLVVIAVVFWVLHRRIAVPLQELTSATNRIASGDFQVALDDSRPDELGRLAHAFNTMTQEVAARTTQLQNTLDQQAISVSQTTATMDELNQASQQSAEQAEAAATGARQVLTLVEGDDREFSS
ncbi:MAG TPA: HAMP domain-containing protein, partial [Candidatus Obscuribacterales bacterium]